MFLYNCNKCGMGFTKKYNYNKHANKKFDCATKNPNDSQKLTEINFKEQSKNIKNDDLDIENTNTDIEKEKSEFKCDNCDGIFTKKSNLTRHVKLYCKFIKNTDVSNDNNEHTKNSNDDLACLNNSVDIVVEQLKGKDSQIDMLIEQNCEMQKQNKQLQKLLIEESVEHKKQTAELHKMIFDLIKKETKKKYNSNKTDNRNNGTINNDNSTNDNSTTNNSTTNTSNTNNTNTNNGTINNNITIQFGKEDLSQIDNKHFLNLIKSNSTGAKIITDIVKMIHFNEDCPQFQNICMSDLNRGRVIMYDGDKWTTITNGDKIIPDLIEKAVSYSHSKDNQLREEYKKNPRVIGRMDVIKKHTNRCDSEHLEDLKEEQLNEEADNKDKIADCEQFIILVSNRVKELIYNEKDKVIKRKESTK